MSLYFQHGSVSVLSRCTQHRSGLFPPYVSFAPKTSAYSESSLCVERNICSSLLRVGLQVLLISGALSSVRKLGLI